MSNFYTDVIVSDPRFDSLSKIADINLLEPITRHAVAGIIADAATQGIMLMVFETYRSQSRQETLFRHGSTRLKTVGVHHYGLAADLVKNIHGEPSWKGDFTFLRDLAQKYGMIWGGDWGQPSVKHTFVDGDHVQRIDVLDQTKLFDGVWYPDDTYHFA